MRHTNGVTAYVLVYENTSCTTPLISPGQPCASHLSEGSKHGVPDLGIFLIFLSFFSCPLP
jgi:hypothetical protein